MGLISFIKQFFGIESIKEKNVVKTNNQINTEETEEKTTVEENSESTEETLFWWEIAAVKNEDVKFEAASNSELYDELNRNLHESRLEIIEIPDNIAGILDIINRKNFQYPEITNLVEQSPVLTGDFLSISNSAAFNRGVAIKNLKQALPRLGKQTIQSILFLNASKMTVPESPIFQKVAEEIIMESQAVAKICRMLGEVLYSDANEAFLVGLLHNVGKLGLLNQISKLYEIPKDMDAEYHQSLFKNIFSVFYPQAGEIIGKYWKLDERVTHAIGFHLNLNSLIKKEVEEDELKLAAIVNLSSYIARIIGFGDSITEECDLFGQQACDILDFKDSPANRNLLNKIHVAIMEAHLDTQAA